MKTLTYGILAAALGLGLGAGCSKNDSAAPTAPCAAGTVCQSKVDTADAAKAYFPQLVYQTLGTCADQTNMRFTWLASANRVVVAKDATGGETVAELNLFLSADNTYTGVYQENVQKVVDPGYWQTTAVQNRKDLKGTWSIGGTNGTQLVLTDLGAADGIAVNNNLGALLNVSGTTLNAALNGQVLPLVMNRSKISKDLKTAAQVCAQGAQR